MENDILTFSSDGETIISCDKSYKGVIHVPEGVTTIGDSAFADSNIISFIASKSLRTIKQSAFERSKALSEVVLNEGLLKIEHNAFENCCSLTCIDLPHSLQFIGYSCFENTNLQFTHIRQNLKDLGYRAFAHTNTHFEVESNNPFYSSIDGSLFNKEENELIKVHPTFRVIDCR